MSKPRYYKDHRRRRAQIKPAVDALKVVCWRCHELIVPDHTRQGDGWHLGHDDELGGDDDYKGPEHDHCSWQSGGLKRQGKLPVENCNQPTSREW